VDTISIQMNQYSQTISPSGGINSDAVVPKTNSTVQSDASNTNTSTANDVPAILQGINYIKDQLKDLLDSYPPFFPAGHPQRPALIKRIRGLQENIKTSPVDSDTKKIVSADNTLPQNATDTEVSKALDNLYKLGDSLNNNQQLSTEPAKPGSLLSIKV
jgi:hypothetical protein